MVFEARVLQVHIHELGIAAVGLGAVELGLRDGSSCQRCVVIIWRGLGDYAYWIHCDRCMLDVAVMECT